MVGLGLFAPLPLAVMIPFMAGQSFAMGEAFGKGFQYGKRKVSSMTNEQFNASSGPQMFAETTADITAMIPTMSKGMEKFHTLQTDIILKMIDYIAKLPAEVVPDILNAPGLIVPQEFKINYPQEISKLSKQFTDVLERLIPNLGQTADASVYNPIIDTSDQSDAIRIQNAINEQKIKVETSVNPNVNKITYNASTGVRTWYNNKGQVIKQEIDEDKAPTVIARQGVGKTPEDTRPRAPTSVRTQVKKWEQEIIAANAQYVILIKRHNRVTPAGQNWRNIANRAKSLIAVTKKKYNFN